MRRPIPRSLLPHSARLFTETTDAWQHSFLTEICNLEHIRIEASEHLRTDEQNNVKTRKWLLFFDCCHSLPRGTIFSPGQIVEWLGHRLTILQVTPVWEDRQLHHYEVKLQGL